MWQRGEESPCEKQRAWATERDGERERVEQKQTWEGNESLTHYPGTAAKLELKNKQTSKKTTLEVYDI